MSTEQQGVVRRPAVRRPAEGIPLESVLTLLSGLLLPAVVGHQASLAVGTDSESEEHLHSLIRRAISGLPCQ